MQVKSEFRDAPASLTKRFMFDDIAFKDWAKHERRTELKREFNRLIEITHDRPLSSDEANEAIRIYTELFPEVMKALGHL